MLLQGSCHRYHHCLQIVVVVVVVVIIIVIIAREWSKGFLIHWTTDRHVVESIEMNFQQLQGLFTSFTFESPWPSYAFKEWKDAFMRVGNAWPSCILVNWQRMEEWDIHVVNYVARCMNVHGSIFNDLSVLASLVPEEIIQPAIGSYTDNFSVTSSPMSLSSLSSTPLLSSSSEVTIIGRHHRRRRRRHRRHRHHYHHRHRHRHRHHHQRNRYCHHL